MIKTNHIDSSKIDYVISKFINKFSQPNILEFGVQSGSSTKKFLEICQINNGKLYSVDIHDYSNLFKDENWTFIQDRDDNFNAIKEKIPKKIDIIYLDTIHTAKHVQKIFHNYYEILNKSGLFIIDDISWLPYLKNSDFNNFFCEINNKETFDYLLNIYNSNLNNFELSFFFKHTGTAVIEKLTINKLNYPIETKTREYSLKNILRKNLNK